MHIAYINVAWLWWYDIMIPTHGTVRYVIRLDERVHDTLAGFEKGYYLLDTPPVRKDT
jgi:hypothetical protein